MAKHRSPSYPNVTIEDAVKTAQTLYNKEKRHPVPVEVIAKHAGYADIKSSSAIRLVASLNHYGLVVETGAGEDRKMKLSDRALDIILAESPDSPKRLAAIREAALAPTIHQRILKEFPEQLPSIPTLKNFLIRDLDFNDTQVDTFINKFIKTVDFAGLYADNTDNEEGGDDPAPGPKVGDFIQWTSGGVDRLNPPEQIVGLSPEGGYAFVASTRTGIPMGEITIVDPILPPSSAAIGGGAPPLNPNYKPATTDAVVDKPGFEIERKTLDEGVALLQLPEKLNKDSFDDLEYWIKGILKRAKRKAGIKDKPKDQTPNDGDDEDE